jgi:hypothetical protein
MYIAALPNAWTARNEMRQNPVKAMTAFLPRDELTKEMNHMTVFLSGLKKMGDGFDKQGHISIS